MRQKAKLDMILGQEPERRELKLKVPERIRPVILGGACAAGLGVVLAAFGPYGTFGMAALPERLAYWTPLLVASYLVYRPALGWADSARGCSAVVRFAARAGAVCVATVPMTFIVWLASFRHTPQMLPTPELYLGLYPSVLVVGGVLSGLVALIEARAGPRAAQAGDEAAPSQPLLDLLPPHIGRDLLALEMEDHYVRAHTLRGSALLLMRMRDAVSGLSGLDGDRIHRSWWVARAAVSRVEREGRSVRLVPENGLRVPVPRERVPELRAAGWIPNRTTSLRRMGPAPQL